MTLVQLPDEERKQIRSGIAFTVLCYFLFSLHDASIKWLLDRTSLWLILFARSTTILVLCLLSERAAGLRSVRDTPLKSALILRGVMILCAWLCYYNAARTLQLAQLTTIYFAAPIIITILAVPVLKETITPARWVGVFVGFGGVLIACRPGDFHSTYANYLALLAAFLWAASTVLVRKVSLAAGSFLQMFYSNAVFALATIGGTIVTWHSVSLQQWSLLLLIGVLGGAGQLSFFEAMRRAPASVLAPFEYTSLVWAFILGYAIWGDAPKVVVFVGAAIIICSGIVVVVFDHPIAAASSPDA